MTTPAPSKPHRDGESVKQDIVLETRTVISLVATGLKTERTGLHAKFSMIAAGTPLRSSYMNMDRDEDRLRLSNRFHVLLTKEDQAAMSKERLNLLVDQFASQLWDAWIAHLKPVEVEGDAEAKPAQMVLNPYIIQGGGTLLFAPPGRGKSTIALLMAQTVNSGATTVWRPDLPMRTMFVNLERSAQSLRSRLGNVNAVLGLPRNEKLLMLNARGRGLLDVIDGLRWAVEQHKVELVVLDSLSRAGMGKLVADDTANNFTDSMNALCETWLAIAHTPKANDTVSFGSVHFTAGADIEVRLVSEEKDDGTLGVGLQVVKVNEGRKPPMEMLALEFGSAGLTKVRPAGKFEFPELLGKRKMGLAEEVKEYLLSSGKASATDIAAALDRPRPKVSVVLQGEAFMNVGRNGHQVLYGVKSLPDRPTVTPPKEEL